MGLSSAAANCCAHRIRKAVDQLARTCVNSLRRRIVAKFALPLCVSLLSKILGSGIERWAAILGIAGGLWMIFVVGTGLLFLAMLTRYPGAFAARLLQFIVSKPEQPMTGARASSGRTGRCACW